MISRDWSDVHGNFLGSCETHFAASTLSGEKRDAARQYLDGLNVDSLEPDVERVAGGLVAVGRGNDIGDLVQGAKLSDFDIHHTGALWEDWGNARILQDGLQTTIFTSLSDEMTRAYPDLADTLAATAETQCTTDPATPVAP
ncbi:hypothetical protein ASF51_13315 [Agreia sp. Leaf283]|nr:hypothetical protein ASF51_13315 [Agreia sp. Leaf283]